MIVTFYVIIAFLIYVLLSIIYLKRTIKNFINEELRIITGLKNKENISDIPETIKTEYDETLSKIISQENQLDTSIQELQDFRKELDITYNTLVSKSSQLEYSNQMLEVKVKNLSDLNQISKVVLSTLDINKLIDILVDAYFVMTETRRLSIYLWEEGNLINKRIKGPIDYYENVYYPIELKNKFTTNDFYKIYYDLSKRITVLNDETTLLIPLRVKDKELGVLFVVHEKDKLIDLNREMLSALGIQSSIAIENSMNHLELLVKERISQEIEMASKIQKQILPQSLEKFNNLKIATFFAPAKEIGGDYYDYSIKNNIFSMNIADVSGKGVAAAFLMALSRSMLKTITYVSNYKPAEELNLFNKIIFDDITEDMFITIMNAKFNFLTRELTYSSAGHNPFIFYKKDEEKISLCGTKGAAIGFIKDYSYKENSIILNDGDIVIFYTDGVVESENVNHELYGIERLKKIVMKNKDLEPNGLKEKILESIFEFSGEHEQIDDITFVILKYKI